MNDPLVDGLLMLSFDGVTTPEPVLETIRERDIAGFTLFRHLNFRHPEQIRTLTDTLQGQRGDRPPLLIAADQETGQLAAMGEPATPFPGTMALGAAGDAGLTRNVGLAVGTELRAMGINVDYAPVCDVNTNPDNPSLGIRSFGDDPAAVAVHAAALIEGIQTAGVAATMKHFPGKGHAQTDSHHTLPVLRHDRERLDTVELVPFAAAIGAGVRLTMTGHFALPALTGTSDLPCTMAPETLRSLLRDELGFEGVVITDALDMKALTQGTSQIIDVIAAVRAGVDLLLLTTAAGMQERTGEGLSLALSRRLIDPADLAASHERVRHLKVWLAGFPTPDLSVVGSPEHRALAAEVATRSTTLVRDQANLLPLRPAPNDRILVIQPEPTDLTPADTSSFESARLADAVASHHPAVDRLSIPHGPADVDVTTAVAAATRASFAVVGTVCASMEPSQAELVRAVLATGTPTVTVALRTPYDLTSYPESRTHLCTYSIKATALNALAAVLFGEAAAPGRLPVRLGDLYPRGHGGTR
jgi:beta-N-acetylhexosaminidase